MASLRSRGSTGRRKDNPLGWEHYDSVKKANIMVGRVCILLMLAAAKSIFWILEQPINSLMEHHPVFQALMKLIPIRRMPTHMSWFGGATRKPTWLYSSGLHEGQQIFK